MAAKALPSQEVLRQLLRYEPETGKLFWKERGAEWFSDGRHSAAHTSAKWNSKLAGKEAFTAVSSGYRYGALFGQNFLAHRVIWKIMTGQEPDQIDHQDGNRQNNMFANLRDVSETENHRNACLPSHNTSGRVGVSYSQDRNAWEAYITLGDRKKNLGRFKEFDDAVAARRAAEIEHGFHQNHGRST